MLEKSGKGKKWKKKQSEIRLFTSTSNDPRFAPLLDPDSSPKKWEANSRPSSRPNGRPDGRPLAVVTGTLVVILLVISFWGKRLEKKGEKKGKF